MSNIDKKIELIFLKEEQDYAVDTYTAIRIATKLRNKCKKENRKLKKDLKFYKEQLGLNTSKKGK